MKTSLKVKLESINPKSPPGLFFYSPISHENLRNVMILDDILICFVKKC